MPVVIGPGFHGPELTEGLVRSLPAFIEPHVIGGFPADPIATFRWLKQIFDAPDATHIPLVAVGFSAGVVGLTGALTLWQQQGGQVARFFAVDGWGVPIVGLPVCRLSHDAFTHWSSLPLGAGDVNFYADPGVDHLDLWGRAEQVTGRRVAGWHMGESADGFGERPCEDFVTAAEFLRRELQREWENPRMPSDYR